MLDPDDRRLYTDALRPPPGFRFSQAIATTYSLDLETLLTIPLHLALFSANQPMEELLKDGVGLLEAIRRTTERVTVFAQGSRVIAPSVPHGLYPLLESVVIEAFPPNPAGSFHPKLWLLRFDEPDTEEIRLRLVILTRNITNDRCWDLALTLDGQPTGRRQKDNRQLCDLLLRLPELAIHDPADDRAGEVEELAELAQRTSWELPNGFEQVRFHALGIGRRRSWLPEKSEKLVILSPFLSEPTLKALLDSTRDPVALISRPEELDKINPKTRERFQRVLVLAEQAELEDGEEGRSATDHDLPAYGLHAKGYLTRIGWNTHVYVGSANATAPALLSGANVEIMAELVGKRSRVGEVDSILEAENFGSILMDYLPPGDADPPDPKVETARVALEAARRKLVTAGLRVRFDEVNGQWSSHLVPPGPSELKGVGGLTAWLVTRRKETAVLADGILEGKKVELAEGPLSLLTSFVVFELTSDAVDESVRFVLNLTTENMPVAERDASIVRDVIRNREGFLRYVMLLLAEAGEGQGVFGSGGGAWAHFNGRSSSDDGLPIFEHLTRTFCREPDRLRSVRRLIEEIGTDGDGEVVPPGFLELWDIFEAAIEEDERAPG